MEGAGSTSAKLRDLERAYERTKRDIRDYPRPIPGCDAQFDHLLEERSRRERELARRNLGAKDDEGDP